MKTLTLRFLSLLLALFLLTGSLTLVSCSTPDGEGDTTAEDSLGSTGIGELSRLKGVELDYGVLPWPLYDGNQENYVSRCGDAWLHCVPTNTKDPERTSVIMQALAYYSYGTVYKAYYDQALTAQYVRDPDSVDMMQIILSTLSVDLGDTIWFENLRFPITKTFLDKKGNIGIASTLKQYERAAKREIDKVSDFLAKKENG